MADNAVPVLDNNNEIVIDSIPCEKIMNNIPEKTILHVDKRGNNDNVGNELSPYLTITAAVEKAKTMSPSQTNPIAILIRPGIYNEQVIIDVSGINLYGFGQGVTQIIRNGTALILRDNGEDTPPIDFKCVGVSAKSTNSDEYTVRIEGINGSSLGNSELQFRDGRIGGTLSIYANLCNYIDYQNQYIMGKQLYEQVSGIWNEDSESNQEIKVDWDADGEKPSDDNHYGVNFVRHLPRGDIVLINDAIIGDDYRARKLGDTAGTVCEGNDARLTESREPTAHATSHEVDGTDEMRLLLKSPDSTIWKLTVDDDGVLTTEVVQ